MGPPRARRQRRPTIAFAATAAQAAADRMPEQASAREHPRPRLRNTPAVAPRWRSGQFRPLRNSFDAHRAMRLPPRRRQHKAKRWRTNFAMPSKTIAKRLWQLAKLSTGRRKNAVRRPANIDRTKCPGKPESAPTAWADNDCWARAAERVRRSGQISARRQMRSAPSPPMGLKRSPERPKLRHYFRSTYASAKKRMQISCPPRARI